MRKTFISRYRILLLIIAFYLLPIILLTTYSQRSIPWQNSWELLSLGLLLAAFGTFLLFWLITIWEANFNLNMNKEILNQEMPIEAEAPMQSSQPSSIESERPCDLNSENDLKLIQQNLSFTEQKLVEALSEVQLKNDEMQKLNKDNLRYQRQAELVLQELAQYKLSSQNQIEKHEKLVTDSQQTIAEQRALLEKKQQQVSQLEQKVRDLTYEIKTLLQLAEIGSLTSSEETVQEIPIKNNGESESSFGELSISSDKQVHSFEEATIQLKRCIDIAQKITGASHYNHSNSRFRDLPVDNYTLDLRRLFDCLRSENACAVFFYSQKENKILFANNQTKGMLGWNPEKFVQNFTDIIQQSQENWRTGLSQLSLKNESKFTLLMKSKAGQEIPIECLLGIIPTGIFRNHVIGVLFKS